MKYKPEEIARIINEAEMLITQAEGNDTDKKRVVLICMIKELFLS